MSRTLTGTEENLSRDLRSRLCFAPLEIRLHLLGNHSKDLPDWRPRPTARERFELCHRGNAANGVLEFGPVRFHVRTEPDVGVGTCHLDDQACQLQDGD